MKNPLAKKPAASDPATMTTDEFDEYVGDVRLPALRIERDEISRLLAELFLRFGQEMGDESAAGNEHIEVQRLLTGRPDAPVTNIPTPALQGQMHRRRQRIDKAIVLAEAIAGRVEMRRQAARLEEAMPQARELARLRVIAALRLQAVTKQLLDLETSLGLDTRYFSLPTTGQLLLGPGLPGDEVDVSVDALLTAGMLSRKDVADARSV